MSDAMDNITEMIRNRLVFGLCCEGISSCMKGMFDDACSGDTTGSKELAVCLRNIADVFEYDPSNIDKYIEVVKVLKAIAETKVAMQNSDQ